MLPFIPLHILCTNLWQLVHCIELLPTTYATYTTWPSGSLKVLEKFLSCSLQLQYLKIALWYLLMEQEMMGWQWHQQDRMQIICTSLQTVPRQYLTFLPVKFFCRPNAVPAAQPTVSKHWRQRQSTRIRVGIYHHTSYEPIPFLTLSALYWVYQQVYHKHHMAIFQYLYSLSYPKSALHPSIY